MMTDDVILSAALSVGSQEYLNPDDSDFWLEEMRGADVAAEMTLAANVEGMRAQLEDKAVLGRLKFLNRHGLDETGAISKLIAMGARGVSIFDMSNDEATLAWDSGDEIEKLHAEYDPDGAKGVFNPEHADSPDDLANCCFDGRSDDKGAETESVETGMCGGESSSCPAAKDCITNQLKQRLLSALACPSTDQLMHSHLRPQAALCWQRALLHPRHL